MYLNGLSTKKSCLQEDSSFCFGESIPMFVGTGQMVMKTPRCPELLKANILSSNFSWC